VSLSLTLFARRRSRYALTYYPQPFLTTLAQDLKLADGSVLYVERVDLSRPAVSPLKLKVEEETNRIEVRFNTLESREYSHTLQVDKRISLAAAKEKIAKEVRRSCLCTPVLTWFHSAEYFDDGL
jgi:hypothetical protein